MHCDVEEVFQACDATKETTFLLEPNETVKQIIVATVPQSFSALVQPFGSDVISVYAIFSL